MQGIKRDFNEVLIYASKDLFIPSRMKPTLFPNKIYNHIINIYEENNLRVDSASLNSLVELTRSTRNVLQCLNSRLAKTKIPSIFHHNITTYENRDRIQQDFVKSSANLLLQNMNKCNYIFLSNSKWSDYKTSLEVYKMDIIFVLKICN